MGLWTLTYSSGRRAAKRQVSMDPTDTNRTQVSTELEGPQGFFAGQRKLYIAVAMLALAVGFFAFSAFQEATVYYLTVGEVTRSDIEVGKTMRVSGKLLPDSFQREGEGVLAHFTLTEGDYTLNADYNGIVPELFFNEHTEIVLEGYFDGDRVFQSNTVIVKCPSKYQAEAETRRTSL